MKYVFVFFLSRISPIMVNLAGQLRLDSLFSKILSFIDHILMVVSADPVHIKYSLKSKHVT